MKTLKLNTNKTHISKEKAIAIAKGHTNGKVIETDFDSDDNEYEIEIKTETGEVEITIDSRSGKIIEVNIDDHDDDAKVERKATNRNTDDATEKTVKVKKLENTQAKTNKNHISKEEAIAIAKGHTNGKVIETEFDSDDNEYEIEIKTDTGRS